jgi:hypothetical protein
MHGSFLQPSISIFTSLNYDLHGLKQDALTTITALTALTTHVHALSADFGGRQSVAHWGLCVQGNDIDELGRCQDMQLPVSSVCLPVCRSTHHPSGSGDALVPDWVSRPRYLAGRNKLAGLPLIPQHACMNM